MIENVWSILCKRAIEDRRTGNISLIENIQRLNIDVLPDVEGPIFTLVDSVLASLWINMDNENKAVGEVDVSIKVPKGKEYDLVSFSLDIKSSAYARYYLQIRELEIKREGRYQIIFRIKEPHKKTRRKVATVPLDVVYNRTEDAISLERRT